MGGTLDIVEPIGNSVVFRRRPYHVLRIGLHANRCERNVVGAGALKQDVRCANPKNNATDGQLRRCALEAAPVAWGTGISLKFAD